MGSPSMPKITACDSATPATPAPPPRLLAAPGVLWREDYCCFGFGTVKHVCVGAWVFFLLIPGLFFWLVVPGMQARLGIHVTLAALGMYLVATLCFVCTSCWDPGVPNRPPALPALQSAEKAITGKGYGKDAGRSAAKDAGEAGEEATDLEHPGEGYMLSRDSNRYVRSFDHFCEFVGNDIGSRNMPCFVGFLVSLALFSSLLLLACIAATAVMWLGWTPGWSAPGSALHHSTSHGPSS